MSSVDFPKESFRVGKSMEEKWRESQEAKDDERRKDRESVAMAGKRNILVCGECHFLT